ncbi:MAG: hypothetical protein IJK23_01500, partial [Clostridia bacterium]|nr:hypothetical protein [Clostridia bacterium]
ASIISASLIIGLPIVYYVPEAGSMKHQKTSGINFVNFYSEKHPEPLYNKKARSAFPKFFIFHFSFFI